MPQCHQCTMTKNPLCIWQVIIGVNKLRLAAVVSPEVAVLRVSCTCLDYNVRCFSAFADAAATMIALSDFPNMSQGATTVLG